MYIFSNKDNRSIHRRYHFSNRDQLEEAFISIALRTTIRFSDLSFDMNGYVPLFIRDNGIHLSKTLLNLSSIDKIIFISYLEGVTLSNTNNDVLLDYNYGMRYTHHDENEAAQVYILAKGLHYDCLNRSPLDDAIQDTLDLLKKLIDAKDLCLTLTNSTAMVDGIC